MLHRLDYSTAGVLAVPLTAAANAAASKSLSSRAASKFCLALLRGHLERTRCVVRVPVGEDARPEWAGVRMCASGRPHCREETVRKAETWVMVVGRGTFRNEPATKVIENVIGSFVGL